MKIKLPGSILSRSLSSRRIHIKKSNKEKGKADVTTTKALLTEKFKDSSSGSKHNIFNNEIVGAGHASEPLSFEETASVGLPSYVAEDLIIEAERFADNITHNCEKKIELSNIFNIERLSNDDAIQPITEEEDDGGDDIQEGAKCLSTCLEENLQKTIKALESKERTCLELNPTIKM